MKTITNTRKVMAGITLAAGSLFAMGASADEITAWNFVTDGGFIIGNSTCNNGPDDSDCNLEYDNTSGVTPSTIPNTASIVKWGTPSTSSASNGEQSGLQGVFGATGEGSFNAELLGSGEVPIPMFEQIITNGGWTNTGAAAHYNNIITPDGGFMETSTLRSSFQLLSPEASSVFSTDLDIVFNETPNTGGCPLGNPHGTICDDVFNLSGVLNPFTFAVDGQLYKASFQFADGPGAIVVNGTTIFTAEDSPGTAVMFVQGRIDTIPLPGILALMGMGLVMIGWQVRGRKRV
ncbi:MAG: THxN family PEP-CTERM protein [Pseudohongiellaceae bacterium]